MVIWDLDDAFWKGTISEGQVHEIIENTALVKSLVSQGVMNSICSKNNFEQAKAELERLGIWDLFVFPSISWDNKGERIKSIINEMQLRECNVLFVDDIITNLEEARFYSPGIQTITPDKLFKFIEKNAFLEKNDPLHFRLKQYKILEHRAQDKQKLQLTDTEFLMQSNINCEIVRDWQMEAERAFKIMQRTNQLNFTKNKTDEIAISKLFLSAEDSGLIRVTDKYGDYGFVGFFAIEKGELTHFAFSCRVIGMQIEQFVYAELGYPTITVIGDVACMIDNRPKPKWIACNKN